MHDPYTADDEKAWSYSLPFPGQIADLLKQRQIPLLVVIAPMGAQVEPVPAEYAAQVGARFFGGGKRIEYLGYQQRVSAYCRSKGIPYLDLLPAFRAANPSGRRWLYLPRDQHWTVAGHALAAGEIARYLQAHSSRFLTRRR